MAVTSRIYFRGVDLVGLTNQYLNNEFVDVDQPIPVDLDVLKEESHQIVNIHTPTITPSCEISKGGNRMICLGHLISENGTYQRLDPSKEFFWCMNCHRKITVTKDVLIWSIPIKREGHDGVYTYHGLDVFCTPECTYRKYHERKHNTIYQNSEIYLKEMFQIATGHPGTELRPASDPRMLKCMNGPVDWATYHKMSSVYTEKPTDFIIYPALEFIERTG